MFSHGFEPIDKLLRAGMFVSLGWIVLATAIVYFLPVPFENLNHRAYDWKLAAQAFLGRPEAGSDIVHLDVDDQAINKYGQWPWDRRLSARIVERLREFQAKAVLLDVIYSTEGRSKEGDEALFKAMADAGNVVASFAAGLTDSPRGQFEFDVDSSRWEALLEKALDLKAPPSFNALKVNRLNDHLVPLPPVIRFSASLGHISATPDNDGVHRRIALVIQLGDRYHPSLSLAGLMAWYDAGRESVKILENGNAEIDHGGKRVAIPLDSGGMMLINWSKPANGFEHWSVIDVLSDKPDRSRAGRYKGKIVIVGLAGSGDTDTGSTPLGVGIPLSRTHSQALYTMMAGRFIGEVAAFPFIVLVTVLMSAVFLYVAARVRIRDGILVCAGLCVSYWALTLTVFLLGSIELPWSQPFFIFLPAGVVCLIFSAAATDLKAARTSWALERYFSHEVLELILGDAAGTALETKRRELTIMFVDIEGFSEASETAEVEYLTAFLNEFYEAASEAVFEHMGVVNKFLGDGLLAFFGEPVPVDNPALSAVRAALTTLTAVEKLSSKWRQSGVRQFRKGVKVRIGINTGVVIVGNLGSRRRMEYTVVGSAVNVASRLQAKAPPGGILISARTHALVRDHFQFRGPQLVRVKGFADEMEVYEVESALPPGALPEQRTGHLRKDFQ